MDQLKRDGVTEKSISSGRERGSCSQVGSSRPQKSSKGYRVDRNKVQAILQEAVENPDLACNNLIPPAKCLGKLLKA